MCEDEIKINGVKSNIKYKKRKEKTKVKDTVYHLQDKDNVETVGINKEAISLKKRHRNDVSSM